uniref:Galectin n=1 Tax=Xenopus tropicalis TaxID=8364 RepID=A0A6I8RNQ7_XENTR
PSSRESIRNKVFTTVVAIVNIIVFFFFFLRFAVNFKCFNNDTAFHFNPRFDDGNIIVCNTELGNKWGSEERMNHMPFIRNRYFKINITVQEDQTLQLYQCRNGCPRGYTAGYLYKL